MKTVCTTDDALANKLEDQQAASVLDHVRALNCTVYSSTDPASGPQFMVEPRQRKKRAPRPMTVKRLERMAVHYLGRYPASVSRFRRVMQRKMDRAAPASPDVVELFAEWLDDVESKCRRLGLLDDEAYAKGVTRSLHRQGLAQRAIRMRLRQKGVEADAIDLALSSLNPEGHLDVDLVAAIVFARKKRLGPWCSPDLRKERYRRHMGAMARRGFGFGLAKRILDADANELEELLVDHDKPW